MPITKEDKDKMNRERNGCPECYHHKGLHSEDGCVRSCKCQLIYP